MRSTRRVGVGSEALVEQLGDTHMELTQLIAFPWPRIAWHFASPLRHFVFSGASVFTRRGSLLRMPRFRTTEVLAALRRTWYDVVSCHNVTTPHAAPSTRLHRTSRQTRLGLGRLAPGQRYGEVPSARPTPDGESRLVGSADGRIKLMPLDEESKSHACPVYSTTLGDMWHGDAIDVMRTLDDESVDLVLTSPPFALTRSKEYGNEPEDEYVDWFRPFAKEIQRVLKTTGSLVVDLGGAFKPGQPVKSLYQYRLLIDLVDNLGFHLAQDFYWFNRSKLPGPAQWVTVDRVRAKDAVNCIWWLGKTQAPKADNRRVLKPYSPSMKRLIERKTYNTGGRPSEHRIGKEWAKNHGGAIPPNVIGDEDLRRGKRQMVEDAKAYFNALETGEQLLVDGVPVTALNEPDNLLDYANTDSVESYHHFCRRNDLSRHPARFPRRVVEFFINFLTEPDDLVVDPFGGSNMTGAVAEDLGRRWLSIDLVREYIVGSLGRFDEYDLVFHGDDRKGLFWS